MANGTPKPLVLVKGHRTKAEKDIRAKAEESLVTKKSFKEWPEVKSDPDAHRELQRLKKLFKAINKDEGLHETTINRYCQLHSECRQLKHDIGLCDDFGERMKMDDKLMAKRKAMLDIEKENLMTVQSVLRSIPKKPDDKPKSKMAEYLAKRAGSDAT